MTVTAGSTSINSDMKKIIIAVCTILLLDHMPAAAQDTIRVTDTPVTISVHNGGVPITDLTVRLISNRFTDLANNTTTELNCEFIAHGMETIQWKQNGGNVVDEFTIRKVSVENADNLNANGTTLYKVDLSTRHGSIKLIHEDGKVRLILHLPDKKAGLHLDFEISAYEIL